MYNDMVAFKKTQDQPKGGGRLSATKVPGANDFAVKLAKSVPGPGAYDPDNAYKGPSGGRFGLEEPMDTLTLSIKAVKDNPGPGAYYRDFQVGLMTTEGKKKAAKKARCV